jgi:hypothetical protein
MRRPTLALCLFLLSLSGAAQAASAADVFTTLAGEWSGVGTVNFSDNSQERLRCRAAYDVLRSGDQLQLSIRCASPSYNFDLLGKATDDGGRITGSWNEASMNVAGQLAGVARGNRIDVTASSAGFTATLGLVTRDRQQSVSIHSQDPSSKLRGATITLTRR